MAKERRGDGRLEDDPTAGTSREKARVIASLGGALAIAIGVIAIVGWGLHSPALTQFFSHRSAMQPITALSAIVAGTAILLATGRDRLIVAILAMLVVLAGGQTLAEYLFRIELGIDHLFFAVSIEHQGISYPHPGRMAAPTAAAFFIIGIALLSGRARGRASGTALSAGATAVVLLALVALLSHFYMVAPLTGVLGFTQVSIPTALALGGLSIGVLALRPDDGWVRLLIGSSVGATAARWLMPVVVVVPIAVASLALQGSELGLYPSDFRLAFTTAVTIVLLAGLALWGAWQLDRLVAVRRTADALRESEATLRTFFETEGLFAAIIEQTSGSTRYLRTNTQFAGLFGHADLSGMDIHQVHASRPASALLDRLERIRATGSSLHFEEVLEADADARWFAVTISPIKGNPADPPRFATTAFEITERKRAEVQQDLLRHELGHRLKNVLTVVQSVASQTLRQATDLPSANRALAARLAALGEATNLLTAQSWEAADLRSVIDRAMAAHGGIGGRIRVAGPIITLQPQVTLALALALHELATNAAKYGALSTATGHVRIDWRVTDGTSGAETRFHLCWREHDGPEVQAPTRRGFGSTMIERSLAAYFRGEAIIAYPPEGAVFTLDCPLAEAGRISELA